MGAAALSAVREAGARARHAPPLGVARASGRARGRGRVAWGGIKARGGRARGASRVHDKLSSHISQRNASVEDESEALEATVVEDEAEI